MQLPLDEWHKTKPNWWKVNIGSGNGLAQSGNKLLPGPMLTQIYVAIWYNFSHNKLTRSVDGTPTSEVTPVTIW